MASNTTPQPRRSVLAVAVTALLVASAAAAGVSLTAVGTASAAPTGIDECTTIDEPGVYELTSDVSPTSESDSPCVRITASDVAVEGNGHAIGRLDRQENGRPLPTITPIVVGGADPVDNVTVTEATVLVGASAFTTPNAIVFENASDSSLLDVRVESNAMPNIKVEGDDNTFRNVSPSSRWGATFEVTGNGTLIADSVSAGAGESAAFHIEGDGTVLRNVTGTGIEAGTLVGDDVVVENSTFDSAYQGLAIVDSRNATVVDSEFRQEDDLSPTLENSSAAEIRGNTAPGGIGLTEGSDNNTIRGNVVGRIHVHSGSASNLIYDNRIVGDDPISVYTAGSNRWNVTPRSGENVIGGDTTAGNYYANAEGTGFSQTCEDANGDGLCDSANEFNESNTDYAPLAGPVAPTPLVDGQSPTDPDGDGAFTYDDVIVFFEHFEDATTWRFPSAYDFAGNGGVTYYDVVSLFEEV